MKRVSSSADAWEDSTSQQRLPAGTLGFGLLKSEVYYARFGKGRDIAAK